MYDIASCWLHKHNSFQFKTVSDWVNFFYLTSIYYHQPYFLHLTESKCNWGKTKTERNHVNNKQGAKYGANELFGSVNFTDCIKLARWEFFRNFIKCPDMSYQVELNIKGVEPYISPGCQKIAEDPEHEKGDIISLICKMSVSGKVNSSTIWW